MDRVRIFNRKGVGLADLRVEVERYWGVNDEGEAEFDLVTTDTNCRDEVLRFGNWLLVEHDKLQPWVGMIDVPQEWRRRAVHVCAYSPERILIYRDAPRQLKLSGKSGSIFQQVWDLANRAEATIVSTGDVWMGGKDLPAESVSGDSLLDYLNNLCERSGGEYSFNPVVTASGLRIYAAWSELLGSASNFPLVESYNLEDGDNVLRVQGDFRNELWGYGNGAGQADRPTATVMDAESRSLYGLRQGSEVFSDYTGAGPVLSALQNRIDEVRLPYDDFELSVLDVGESWANLRLGSSYPLRMWSVGFGVSADVRVKGLYYEPSRGKVDLTTNLVMNDSQG